MYCTTRDAVPGVACLPAYLYRLNQWIYSCVQGSAGGFRPVEWRPLAYPNRRSCYPVSKGRRAEVPMLSRERRATSIVPYNADVASVEQRASFFILSLPHLTSSLIAYHLTRLACLNYKDIRDIVLSPEANL